MMRMIDESRGARSDMRPWRGVLTIGACVALALSVAGCAVDAGGRGSEVHGTAQAHDAARAQGTTQTHGTAKAQGATQAQGAADEDDDGLADVKAAAPQAPSAKLVLPRPLQAGDLPRIGSLPLFAGTPGKELPDGWEPWTLHPSKTRTRYRLERDADGVIIAANADAAASGLVRRTSLSPFLMPTLEWRWKVDQLIPGADNTDRYAEDAPVRIVLAFDGDKRSLPMRDRLFFEQVRLLSGQDMPYATLMYIWENRQPVGTVIHNPNTNRVRKLVVASGEKDLKRWKHFRRNVVADYIQAFGKPPGTLIGVAILTDTDNTRQRVSAAYGDLRIGRLPLFEVD